MIDPGLYLAFVLANTVLILIPGPNVALIVANSVGRGTRVGLLTVAGTCAAMLVQVTLTVLGLTAMLSELSMWFEWICWIGVAYLLFLGVRQWRAPPVDLSRTAPQRPIGPQVILLGVTSLVLGVVLDSGWALTAGRVRHVLAARPRLRNRLSGGCLIGAGVGLALAHRR